MIERYTRAIAAALEVVGPINVQFAVKQLGGLGGGGTQVFVIEANPRASRTVPFVSKATGVPLAQVAARVMAGATLAELRAEGLLRPPVTGGHVSVKEAVLPFDRFPDADTLLGPEMRSTGEVMGIDRQLRAGLRQEPGWRRGTSCPRAGRCSSRWPTGTRRPGWRVARRFVQLGFSIGGHRPGPPPTSRPTACRWRRSWWPRSPQTPDPTRPVGRRRRSGPRSGTARSIWWSTRRGAAAPGPTAPTSAGPPTQHQVACLTTVAAARAAAAGHRRPGRPVPCGAQPAGVPRTPSRQLPVP